MLAGAANKWITLGGQLADRMSRRLKPQAGVAKPTFVGSSPQRVGGGGESAQADLVALARSFNCWVSGPVEAPGVDIPSRATVYLPSATKVQRIRLVQRESTHRIGELARLGGVSPRTVDYYTQLGLISPLQRSESNYRLYGPEALQRLELIKSLQTQRLSLSEIAARLEGDAAPAEEVVLRVRAIEARLADMQSELAALAPTACRRPGDEVGRHVARTAGEALARALALAQSLMLLTGEGKG